MCRLGYRLGYLDNTQTVGGRRILPFRKPVYGANDLGGGGERIK